MQHRPSPRRLGSALLLFGACALLASACNVTVTTTDDSCRGFEDEARADGAAMVVRNDSDVTVYLSSQDCDPGIDPAINRGAERLSTEELTCSLTCEQLQTQGQVACAAACAAPTIIALAPGGTYPLEWSGDIFERRTMPEACFFELPGATCDQRTPAADGAYTASIEVYGEVPCPDGMDCSCTPNEDGYCRVENLFDVPQMPVEIATDFQMPAAETVVLAIPGPVSCPATPPNNGDACGNVGLSCSYEQRNPCGQELAPEATCREGNVWLVGANSPFCELSCPELTPTVDSSCQPGTDGTYCAYDGPDACGTLRACNETTSTWDALPCEED